MEFKGYPSIDPILDIPRVAMSRFGVGILRPRIRWGDA